MKMEYISCTLTLFNMTYDRFVQSYKSPAFHPKIRIVALQNAPENHKNVCSRVCKSQNVCPVIIFLCVWSARMNMLETKNCLIHKELKCYSIILTENS